MIRISAVDEANADVVQRAYDMLDDEQGLRTTTADIEILGGDQSLVLAGRVRTQVLYDMADRLARQAAGAWTVDNQLISDEQLAIQISTRIGSDLRTASADVRVDVFLGVARMVGVVAGQEQRAAVLELAGGVAGVVRVEDHLSIER